MLGKSFRNRYLPECSASNFGRQIRKKPPVMAASFVSLPFASYQQYRGVAEAVPVAPRTPCALRGKVPTFVSLHACAPCDPDGLTKPFAVAHSGVGSDLGG